MMWPANFVPQSQHKLLHHSHGGRSGVKNLDDNANRQVYIDVLSDICKTYNIDDAILQGIEHVAFDSVHVYGVQWDPMTFVQKALQTTHPHDLRLAVPEVLKDSMYKQSQMNHLELARCRLSFLLKWNKRAKQLSQEESLLKSNMDPLVAAAVGDKRILLFGEMLRELEYPDMNVVNELQFGSDLTGDVEETGMLPKKFVPALLSNDSLERQAELVRSKFEVPGRGSGSPEIDESVWLQTLEEVDKGWLQGPFAAADIDNKTPISRRFGIKQGDKVRPIDDFTDSLVNVACSTYESPVLHTVDVAAAMIGALFELDLEKGVRTALQLRTFDLTSAYRQIGLSEMGRRYACIAVFNPHEKTWAYFRPLVLPFGAIRSVHSFLRLSRAIWFIGVKGCLLNWTSFYDDFIVVSPTDLAKNSEMTAISLLRLLGWRFAEAGKKCCPFSDSCSALGVLFDLSKSAEHLCEIRNTENRVKELVTDLQSVVTAGHLTRVQAQKLRGRMQFAEGQLFGRTGRRCIKAIAGHASGTTVRMSEHSKRCLERFVKLLTSGDPRVVTASTGNVVHIFTDACYEREASSWVAGLGGVLFDKSSGERSFFSICLTDGQRILVRMRRSR